MERVRNSLKTITKYNTIIEKINEQKRLIDAGIIEKPKPIEVFTAEDWKEYENGISIEDYAYKRVIGKRGRQCSGQ